MWITALRALAIRRLAEVTNPAYPGKRLIGCRNPLLAAERTRKREELLQATERELAQITAATRRARQPLRGQAGIGLRVGKVLGRFKVGKDLRFTITDTRFAYARNAARIAVEAALDGLSVLCTSTPAAPRGCSRNTSLRDTFIHMAFVWNATDVSSKSLSD